MTDKPEPALLTGNHEARSASARRALYLTKLAAAAAAECDCVLSAD